MELEKEFIDQSILRLNENVQGIEKCLDQLSEDEIWMKANNNSNSIGNLILHLCGNITQYIISAIGEKEDQRDRDEEFNTEGGFTGTELIQQLQTVVLEAITIIIQTNKDTLLKVHAVQGFKLSGIGIIMHVVEHLSYHTGQIAFFTKLLKDRDLGFYASIDLNIKNERGNN